ncbi:hypothetical protein DWX43_23800 [Clostridium sp. AF19-22AC]|nr:hypothetical protein DWX43_23800 [Clostridium sp. AF19-22AC]
MDMYSALFAIVHSQACKLWVLFLIQLYSIVKYKSGFFDESQKIKYSGNKDLYGQNSIAR